MAAEGEVVEREVVAEREVEVVEAQEMVPKAKWD